MSASADPATTLQAKVADFAASLDPAELELFAAVIDQAAGPDVEGFALGPVPPTPPLPSMSSIPGPTKPTTTLSSNINEVMKSFGNALQAAARG